MMKPSLQQFQANASNQEMINLQESYTSLAKRVDELEKSSSTSDVTVKTESIANDIKLLQSQLDNAVKSGRQDVKDLQKKFNQLITSAVLNNKALAQQIKYVDDRIQANTDHDNETECILHLDKCRSEEAAAVADQMTDTAVEDIIKKYYKGNHEQQENIKEVLSEFIDFMRDRKRRITCKSLLDSIVIEKHVQHPPLPCGGCQCPICGRCCDWLYTGHQDDWKWIRKFREWDQNAAERWRDGTYNANFALSKGAKCDRSTLYGVSRFLRIVSFGAFDGSALLNHLCVCDPEKKEKCHGK